MTRMLYLLVFLFLLTGCAKLAHMQELLTLKSYSDNQDAQSRYIQSQDAKFQKLLEVVKADRLDEYPTKRSILRNFGDPIFAKKVQKGGQELEQWLYRYAQKYLDSEKVYFFFDESGKWVSWEYERP